MVKRYDSRTPSTLGTYCDFLGISTEQFYKLVEPMRDKQIWEQANGEWKPKDSVDRHPITQREQAAAVDQVSDRALSNENRSLYYNPKNPPVKLPRPFHIRHGDFRPNKHSFHYGSASAR